MTARAFDDRRNELHPAATELPAEANHVLLVVNPQAGRRSAARRVDRLARLLDRRGFHVEISIKLAEASSRANRLHAQGRLRALVGVGGDGTAAELVNRTDQGVPITLLAAGTANLLSKWLGLSGRPDQLCQTITDGNLVRLDAGSANGRVFLLMLSCGFDAEVVRRVHARRKTGAWGGHIGYLSYVKPILASIRTYGYPEIRVYCNPPWGPSAGEDESPLVARWAFVFNLPCYGWGLPLAPEASATDGLLDLCTFRRGSLWNGLRYLVAAQLGARHRRLADCTVRRARRLRIASEEPVAYQIDGDPGGLLPLDVEVSSRPVTLVVPTA
jgi:diacylglycerol kinase (ATP)